MASSGITVLIFTVLCICAVKSGFVKVECKAENVGHYGQQSLLECVVQTSKDVTDPTIRLVAWKKLKSPEDEEGLPLVVFAKEEINKKLGYGFAEPLWNKKNMNITLLITNTTVADDGYYKCTVITDSGDDFMITTLKIQARYSILTVHSIPEKIVPNSDSTLICESRGGYPKGTLHWFDENKHEWTKSSEMEVTRSDDGLIQLTSRLPLFRGSTFSKYTCAVFNASGGKDDEFTVEIPPSPKGWNKTEPLDVPSKIAAPLVVIGSLIVGLLFALLLYRRRSQKARRNSTAPLMGGRRQVSTAEQDVEEGYKSDEDKSVNQDLS